MNVNTARSVQTAADMERLGAALGAVLQAGDLVVLVGALGAGKTTLTRGIGAALNVRGPVTSPTFVLARTHPSLAGGPPLMHVDAYRLGNALELDDLDIDFSGSVVVVEWGQGMLNGVAENWLDVLIERPRGARPSDVTAAELINRARLPVDADADADAEVDEAQDEPRTVLFVGHGPRWAGLALPASADSPPLG